MSYNNPIKDAWSAAGGVNRATMAALAELRAPVCLDGLNPADFTAGTTLALIYGGKLWSRDDLDTTSPHDGVTVIVTADSKRFKSSLLGPLERGVVGVTDFRATPPTSPNTGDAYGVAAAPTGAWAGWADRIAVCLYGGASPIWGSVLPSRNLVAVTGAGLFRTYGGSAWQDGFGLSFSPASVPPQALVVPAFTIEAELTSPPASPLDGLYWLVASGGTGDWAGRDGHVAARVSAAWTYYAPSTGWRAFRKSDGHDRVYYSGAWRDGSRPRIVAYPVRVQRSSSLALSATGYTPSWSTAPTTAMGSQVFPEGTTVIRHAAEKATNRLVLRLKLGLTAGATGGTITVAVFLDSEGTARAGMWAICNVVAGALDEHIFEFELSPGDTSSHDLSIRVMGDATVNKATAQITEVET